MRYVIRYALCRSSGFDVVQETLRQHSTVVAGIAWTSQKCNKSRTEVHSWLFLKARDLRRCHQTYKHAATLVFEADEVAEDGARTAQGCQCCQSQHMKQWARWMKEIKDRACRRAGQSTKRCTNKMTGSTAPTGAGVAHLSSPPSIGRAHCDRPPSAQE